MLTLWSCAVKSLGSVTGVPTIQSFIPWHVSLSHRGLHQVPPATQSTKHAAIHQVHQQVQCGRWQVCFISMWQTVGVFYFNVAGGRCVLVQCGWWQVCCSSVWQTACVFWFSVADDRRVLVQWCEWQLFFYVADDKCANDRCVLVQSDQ